MQIDLLFDNIPLLLLYVITVAIVFLSVICGFGMGSYTRRHKKSEKEAPVGTLIGAMLGLLAFILAFTFGIASTRFDARKQLLLDEVNAIGTAFLRADFLAYPQSVAARNLLKKYVDILVEATRNPEKLSKALVDSEMLHEQLWSQVTAFAGQNNNSILLGLYIQSLNEVFDLHAQRVTVALRYRIPGSIWLALYFVTMLTMWAVGYDFGRKGVANILISLALALAFSIIILLIADLDRSSEGFLTVSQNPMIELQQKLSLSAK
ncbi:MAG: hypothetical protein KJ964_05925 [Verrucomicrobia bacterium]|nr:hypothetical protein [Verrucomicrobiota bacterium]MBU1733792.1 hypothetical protein [Verrucomicrobiota bacterium]MBU1856741.1 hypothetical protein [Verrucomicrobiota bacterium]